MIILKKNNIFFKDKWAVGYKSIGYGNDENKGSK